jgi:hypothetical protein
LRREEHDEENQPEDVAATLLRRALRVEGAGVRDEHPRRGVGVGFGRRRRRRVARGSGSIQLEGSWASERADEICRRTRPRAPRELQFDANAFEFCIIIVRRRRRSIVERVSARRALASR